MFRPSDAHTRFKHTNAKGVLKVTQRIMLRVKLKVKGQGNVDNKDEQEDRSNLLHIPSVIKVVNGGKRRRKTG